jgi:hypothetical protein
VRGGETRRDHRNFDRRRKAICRRETAAIGATKSLRNGATKSPQSRPRNHRNRDHEIAAAAAPTRAGK